MLPAHEYPIRELPADHPIYRAQFEVREFPQIPSIQHWRTGSGSTSERGIDSAVQSASAITDRNGNIMVLMTHNTDISDTWEREGEDKEYFYRFSPEGYAIAIDVMLYAMGH